MSLTRGKRAKPAAILPDRYDANLRRCILGEICLCGLFFLARDAAGKPSAIPHGVLMVVLIFVTIAAQYIIIKTVLTVRLLRHRYELLPLIYVQRGS